MVNSLVVLAESSATKGVNAWLVGSLVLLGFLVCLAVVFVIGGGREHS